MSASAGHDEQHRILFCLWDAPRRRARAPAAGPAMREPAASSPWAEAVDQQRSQREGGRGRHGVQTHRPTPAKRARVWRRSHYFPHGSHPGADRCGQVLTGARRCARVRRRTPSAQRRPQACSRIAVVEYPSASGMRTTRPPRASTTSRPTIASAAQSAPLTSTSGCSAVRSPAACPHRRSRRHRRRRAPPGSRRARAPD